MGENYFSNNPPGNIIFFNVFLFENGIRRDSGVLKYLNKSPNLFIGDILKKVLYNFFIVSLYECDYFRF